MKTKNYQLFLVLFIATLIPLKALDFSLAPSGFAFIPMGESNTLYDVGGGGEFGFEADLSTVWPNPLGLGYTLGIEAAMSMNPLKGEQTENVPFYQAGGSLGLYFFPFSRLLVRADGAIGTYMLAGPRGTSDSGLFFRGGGKLGFRFTPGFTLAANAGWRQLSLNGVTQNSGLYAGLTAQMTFSTGGGANREGVSANLDQYDSVYPVFMNLYQTNSIGSVVLRNNENAEIRNVRLFFRASGYTASEFPCGTLPLIPRGRSAGLPLLADLSPEILRFTDAGRIVGELVIRYSFLGQERQAVRAVTVAVNNRNMVIDGDAAALAAFVSLTSPETLDFARFIAGQSRANPRIGHNANMQYAIWLLEGLRASGIQLGRTYAEDNEAQYPAETLSYGTGNSRDLALLFASALESVAIPSAFISIEGKGNREKGEEGSEIVASKGEGEFLVAVSLGINQSAAGTLFSGFDKTLIINDEVWLPLSMNEFNNGFLACWSKASSLLNSNFEGGMSADFVIVQNAWASYPPAPLPELGRSPVRTDNAAALREVNRVVTQYIEQNIQVIVRQVQTQINTNPTAALYNRLGIAQVRAGRTAEAKTAYERSANMGSVPAMTNRGNLALIENDYAAAERWFRQALQRQPDNATALRGLQQVQGSR